MILSSGGGVVVVCGGKKCVNVNRLSMRVSAFGCKGVFEREKALLNVTKRKTREDDIFYNLANRQQVRVLRME